MTNPSYLRPGVAALVAALPVLLASPRPAAAQTWVSGQATAFQTKVIGPIGPATTALGSTGALVDDGDARTSALLTGSVPLLGGANVLHATTISSILHWSTGEEIASEASLADLAVTFGGSAISADFAMAQVEAPVGRTATGWSTVAGLTVNGVSIVPSGAENQTFSLPGLTLVLNEVQRPASGGITVKGLHLTSLDGAVDVVVASATAATSQ
jgi:hypothetical protein